MISARFIPVAFLLFSFWGSYGQHARENCFDVGVSAMKNIPDYYAQNKRDKVDSLLNNWENTCGKNEYTVRLRTLLKLEDGTFIAFDYDLRSQQSIFAYIEDKRFRLLMDSVHENPRDLYLSYFGDPDTDRSFAEFTERLAQKLLAQYATDKYTDESLILTAYAGKYNDFIRAMTDPACNAQPAIYYRSLQKRIQKMSLFDAYVYSGVWVPYGKNKLLGSHGIIGFGCGIGFEKWIYDANFEFRFGQSRNTYTVVWQNVPTQTNHFFGGYIALDAARELIRTKRGRLYLTGGLGADGFDTIAPDPDNDVQTESIFVFNANAGMSWRWFSRDGSYAGIDARHNFVNYKNPGGTALDGNTMTFRVVFGLMKNERKRRELNYLSTLTGK